MLALKCSFAVAIAIASRRKPRISAARATSMVRALSAALVAAALPVLAATGADLTVTVKDIHRGPGSIRVALYADARSFRHEDRAFRVESVPATSDSADIVFKNVPAGRYAVLAYHDANDNKKLDLILGMFPDEGWGLSNDPEIMGPPRFDPSAFKVVEPTTTVSVRLHY